ncbi:MAG: DUF4388 domain-containing protein [Deltaproteobacteria bacterium]|nr:DUF4388 domain-containing protein [Deltaproteobacteria bacterium]
MATPMYLVKHSDGGLLGPVSLATLKDLFMTGHVPGDSMVSRDKAAFIPIASVPELQPLVQSNQAAKTSVPNYSGYLSDHSFVRVFYRLGIARETGRLLLARGEHKKEIFFVAGHPVFVGSNLPGERIGEYLIAKGVITKQQLDDALVIVGNFGNHLGNTLMGMKVLSPHAFYEHLVGQLRVKIMKLILWTDGRYDFFKDVLYDGPKLPMQLDSLEILTDSVRTLLTKETLEKRLGDRLDAPLVHAHKAPVGVDRLGLNGFESRLYESMNDMRTPQDLSIEMPGEDQGKTALAIAYYLLEIGLVETV